MAAFPLKRPGQAEEEWSSDGGDSAKRGKKTMTGHSNDEKSEIRFLIPGKVRVWPSLVW